MELVSFDSASRMRTSVNDLRSPQDEDIIVTLEQTAFSRSVTVAALPVQIALDIQKLDETLTCFGGLSGVLEMSNSIISNGTPSLASSKTSTRPRAVRFESQTKVTSSKPSPANKLQVRLAGMALTLTGRSGGVSLHSSAVKLVYRDDHVGVQIDKMRLAGPNIPSISADQPLTIETKNTRLTFLLAPEEQDLANLVDLITPSRDKYEDDDEILLDTLLRQRKKGSVVRASVERVRVNIGDPDRLQQFRTFGEELSKL
ncbi:hypothetical protein LTS18_000764, partial [Coniosporium uncinatum]